MNNTFKLSFAAALIAATMTANAGISIVNNEMGRFSIAGNVELNFNYQHRESNASGDNELNQDGRVLMEFSGQKYTSNGHYVGVKAQPLFESTGNIALDDAYFEFGKQEGWAIKAGRFEAYNMFPVGADVFLDYSGDTANDLYTDGAVYTYQMKEARGRGSDGQIMYSQSFDNLYVEFGAMMGNRSDLFNGGVGSSYHGKTIDDSKDSLLIRPVVAYQSGNFTLAGSLETNLVSNAVTANGVDISDRTGYGLTGNWSNDELSINANMAYLEAVDENNLSVGLNAVWNGFGVGYVYSTNEYENKVFSWAEGNVNTSAWYASYEFNNVLEVKDFSVLLGTYFTSVSNELDTQVQQEAFAEDDDFGARVRLYYQF